MIWRLLYNSLFVPLGWLGFQLYGLVNDKARRGIAGRRGLLDRVGKRVAGWKNSAPRVWFHASSMGEFEQAKPIISMLKQQRPDVIVAVTFFSPSGYENSLTYREADLISYIPFDSPGNARRFVRLLRPSAAVIMRYDLWPNHIWALRAAGIPVILANATMRKSFLRDFPLFGGFQRTLYGSLHAILTVTDGDRDVCLGYGLRNAVVETAGDTRYDQVARRCEESRRKQYFPGDLLRGRTVIVIGSSWEDDEKLLLPALAGYCQQYPEMLVVLVPHEPTLEHLAALESRMNGGLSSIRFSQLVSYAGERVIVVDSVGILVSLYQYAHVVYVGGGFGAGIHNVLEPAVYGVPVMIGPNHGNSHEAKELLGREGIIAVDGAESIAVNLGRLLGDRALRERVGRTALEFVTERRGATAKILSYVEKVL
ncbi:MAG TPA: glycosyltransferase N-terminal domain-containing protein [Bacteroidota bacterium]|nr:glycosyltransferase N-terminal domain-containing protein [Bacteroidota bacterium]